VKDGLETELRDRVCAGKLPLDDVMARIETNWVQAYTEYVGPLSTTNSQSPGQLSPFHLHDLFCLNGVY
jgi:hypothetical protein